MCIYIYIVFSLDLNVDYSGLIIILLLLEGVIISDLLGIIYHSVEIIN